MVQIGLRVPESLRERLTAMARAEKRSLNSQVLLIVETALEAMDEGPAKPKSPAKATTPRARAKG